MGKYTYADMLLEELNEKYNPERDLIIGAPDVTHTDYKLMQIIEELKKQVDALEAKIAELN